MMMHKRRMDVVMIRSSSWFVFCSLSMVTGCASLVAAGLSWHTHSVLCSVGEEGGYVSGEQYEVVEPVFVMADTNLNSEKTGMLVAPNELRRGMSGLYSAPESVEFWRRHTDKFWQGENEGSVCVIGILEAGEKLQITDELSEHSISVWFGYDVFRHPMAIIRSGDFIGWTVSLTDISIWGKSRRFVDGRILRKISDEQKRDRDEMAIP